MKQVWTMVTAFLLCTVLFFILKPLADAPTFEEEIEELESPAETEETAPKEQVTGNYVDKIAESPILPKQREKLQTLQQKRLESTKGMEPAKIKIPSIGVDTAIEPTGVLENGEMGVPEDISQVGWFKPGFKAGAKGDSLTGPAIFYHLKKVKIGESVTLNDAEEREMIFEVKEITSYPTDEAPIDEIFGSSDKRMINLITCTGTFNRDIGYHEERLVVSAELITDSAMQEKAPAAPEKVTATSFNISWHAVRDDAIIGYRIYEENTETGEMKKIRTVSLFDRKKVEIQPDANKRYFVASVDVDLNESEKVEAE